MNKFGIHCPNKGFQELEAMLAMGVDNFTLLHPEAWLAPPYPGASPPGGDTGAPLPHRLANP